MSGEEEEATGDSKDQLGIIHAHKWLLSRFTGGADPHRFAPFYGNRSYFHN